MGKILFLSFYFEPDLCAGSFRNTPLAKKLAAKLSDRAEIDVFTTFPHRYSTYQQEAMAYEKIKNLRIFRIKIPSHNGSLPGQIVSFISFFCQVRRRTKREHYDLVYASSSRLFTSYLGFVIARKKGVPLYIDIRDIFYEGIEGLVRNKILKSAILPAIRYVEKKTYSYATHINLISGGFTEYFLNYKKPVFSTYTNGIDDAFINFIPSGEAEKKRKIILYAGNIGDGQGLHKIVPFLARNFEGIFDFRIIGDGGGKGKLIAALNSLSVKNVIIIDPVNRSELLKEYNNADFFLIHLNDIDAFKKVLPSKIFELGALDRPIIAGVSGHPAEFIKENLSNVILFDPCDVDDCTKKLKEYKYIRVRRDKFIDEFSRDKINERMADSIASYLPMKKVVKD